MSYAGSTRWTDECGCEWDHGQWFPCYEHTPEEELSPKQRGVLYIANGWVVDLEWEPYIEDGVVPSDYSGEAGII